MPLLYRILVLLMMLAMVACGGDAGNQGRGRRGGRSAAAVPVKVENVQRREISNYILANTTLEAFQWVDVRSRTSGQVVAILKEEGDLVKVGSVLARLDAEAARLQVTQMEVAHQDAQRAFNRDEKMYQKKLVSDERFENAKTQLDRAVAQLEQAKLNLSYTTISSPVEGTLTIRSVEVGNMVTNNLVVFSVADFDPLLARIRIPEKNIGKVAVGQGARIQVESAPGKIFEGRVKMISPVVNPESGTIKVTIEIPGGGSELLRPGMFASIYIITETHENALVIPKKSLVLEGEGNQIFVYEENEETGAGKAARRKVKVGFSDNEWLEVLTGLSDTDKVITVGQEGLRPGTAVRLVGAGVVASGGRKAKRDSTTASARPGGEGKGQGSPITENREPASESGGDSEAIKGMQVRMFGRFPDLKKAYDEQLKKDPELATNMTKWRAFLGQMREKGILPARRDG
jgi:membrane fusion protein (multidrug efflux system)